MNQDYTPTAEQDDAVRLFRTGANIAIEAGAGAGKTSTLKLIAAAAPNGRGQYVAFNKAIVLDAEKAMPKNVRCNTAHSLAFQAFGRGYSRRINDRRRQKPNDLARMLRLDPLVIAYGMVRKPMAAGYLAGLVFRTIKNFCQSTDLDPERKHMPFIDGIDVPTEDGRRTYNNNNTVWAHIAPAVGRAWADIMDPDGQLPYTHDYYLKGWHLSGPRIDADYILFDEAQDANPVLIDIVRQQHHAQQVFVGDSQQAIYEFTGAVNALDRIREAGGETAYLTQSFRFGQPIADVANGLLARLAAPIRLTGNPEKRSTVATPDRPLTRPNVVLTRTNATSVRLVLEAMEVGKEAAIVGGAKDVEQLAKGAQDLQAGRRASHPDLACFMTWGEAQDYAANDQQGEEIRLLVKLVDTYGADQIIAAVASTVTERQADVVISTAHKSKGREWDDVKLADDFFTPRDSEDDVADSELRLLYVACTRARRTLDVTDCPQATGRKDGKQGRAARLADDGWGTKDGDNVEELDAKALTLRYL